MIRREHFLNKLRELGYRYARETDRVYIYKKPGIPTFAIVPRRDLLREDYVRIALRQCGCAAEDAEKFIVAYRV